ncbi:amylo-alpha-1,6-glucosidase [Nitrospira japonica]|nr:amylo-alpha-1,6-glucosidase [Nitrospira japonica]
MSMTMTAHEPIHSISSHDDVSSWLGKEWLVTNGIGGYASTSLLGIATRRYHGLFIPDIPRRGRIVIVPRLDETIEQGGEARLLAGAEYADGTIDSDGLRCLETFHRERQVPVWTFNIKGSVVEKRVVAPHGQNTVYLHYRLREGPAVRLRLRPFITCRLHDAPLSNHAAMPLPLTIMDGRYEIALPDGMPALKLRLQREPGLFTADALVSANVSYRVDRDRGSDHVEDLFSPGYFSVDLQTKAPVAILFSVEPWEGLEGDASEIFDTERRRLEKLLPSPQEGHPDHDAEQLMLAADQFIVMPGARPQEQMLAHASGDEARTVIAGYHWFGDWGRDTMISLEGLTLCTGRHQEAKAILRTFGRHVKDGLIPNLFPEGAREGLYHTADATLWYFHALDRYLSVTHDHETLSLLYPLLRDILQRHREGTRFHIGVDPRDGLLHAGAAGYQLTWMDAKVDDWVVTPRRGKPVEIQALWYNALQLMGDWAERQGESPDSWRGLAAEVEASFHRRFWYEPGRHLYDVIDGEQGDDASLRPNQILSLSLRFPVLRRERWRPVVEAVTEHLLTPFGLRTLSRTHPDYKSTYAGDLRARDAAYHQGTVWAWLIGHYIDARLLVEGDKAAVHGLLAAFHTHLQDAGIGTISEIFDADPPYRPRGCIAQAWSVAEVLRAHLKTRSA